MKNATIALLSALCLLSGCGQNGKRSGGELPVIDVEGSLGTYRQIPMSELISEVEYIPLETRPEFLIGRTDHVIVTDTRLFIGGYDHCYAFTREGKFISDVGRVGRGPGEWRYFGSMSVDENNQIIYLDTYGKIFGYTWDGEFLRDFDKPRFNKGDRNLEQVVKDTYFLRNNLFLGYIDNTDGRQPHNWMIIDDTGSIIKAFDNHVKFDKEPFSGPVFDSWIMRLSESTYVKEGFNDTLFALNQRDELIPKFVFNIGRYSYPLDKYIRFEDNVSWRSVIVASNMIISQNNVFYALYVGSETGIQTPVGRKVFLPNGLEGHDGGIVLGLYDIRRGKTELLDRDPISKKFGFVNDLDGGLSFWPQYYIESENALVQAWEAYEMKELLTEEYFAAHPAKDPAAHARLRALLKNLDYYDNPVVVVAKLKE